MIQEKVFVRKPKSRILIIIVFILASFLILLLILAIVLYLTLFAKHSNSILFFNSINNNSNNNSSSTGQFIVNQLYLTSKSINDKLEPQVYRSNLCGQPSITPYIEEERIINGYDSVPHSFPWMVSIGFSGPLTTYYHVCGGSLISERFVITAAHCVHPATVYNLVGRPTPDQGIEPIGRIYVGMNNQNNDITSRNTYFIKKITTHSQYVDQSSTTEYDIAIIELTQNVTLSNKISLICLNEMINLKPNDSLYAIGWGLNEKYLTPENLIQVRLDVIDPLRCISQWNINPDSQICAGTQNAKTETIKDTCSGDSGGPLMTFSSSLNQWFLVGIVSFGDYPCDGLGVYTNVKYFYNWITSITTNKD